MLVLSILLFQSIASFDVYLLRKDTSYKLRTGINASNIETVVRYYIEQIDSLDKVNDTVFYRKNLFAYNIL